MERLKKFVKSNYAILICIFMLLAIIFYNFFDYIHMYYGYNYEKVVELYWKQVEYCESGKSVNKEACDNLTYPMTPKEEFKLLDAKTMFFHIIFEHFSRFVCLIVPFIVMMMFLSVVHKDFKSGLIRNLFMRESFNKYKNSVNKKILIISLTVPLFFFLIFIICCVLTRFNFTIQPSVYEIGVYIKWNYDNMLFYLIINYITFVFLCMFYCNIACCFVNKNKNIFIVGIASFISWFVICFIFSNLRLMINSNYTWNRYLNIFDYINVLNYLSECWYGFIVSAMILAITSFFIRGLFFIKKERIIIENEKDII